MSCIVWCINTWCINTGMGGWMHASSTLTFVAHASNRYNNLVNQGSPCSREWKCWSSSVWSHACHRNVTCACSYGNGRSVQSGHTWNAAAIKPCKDWQAHLGSLCQLFLGCCNLQKTPDSAHVQRLHGLGLHAVTYLNWLGFAWFTCIDYGGTSGKRHLHQKATRDLNPTFFRTCILVMLSPEL